MSSGFEGALYASTSKEVLSSEDNSQEEDSSDEKQIPEKRDSDEDSDDEQDMEEDSTEDDVIHEAKDEDPLAPLNKFVFGVNKVFDILLIRPVTLTYKTIIPPFLRTNVSNILNNLKEPVYFFNALFQAEGEKAGHTLARFFLNTIFGLGGLFDIASRVGIHPEINDFGMTLAKWGAGEGFYLVLPLLGPSNLRDGIGTIVDFFLDPFNYYVYYTHHNNLGYIRFGATVLDKRLKVLDITDALDREFDPYTSYRVTFTDNRRYVTRKNENTNHKDDISSDEEEETEE